MLSVTSEKDTDQDPDLETADTADADVDAESAEETTESDAEPEEIADDIAAHTDPAPHRPRRVLLASLAVALIAALAGGLPRLEALATGSGGARE